MKDETKSKFKKYGKRVSFGFALVSLFVLGVGVGACSARNAVGSSAEDIYGDSFASGNLLDYATRVDGYTFSTATPSAVISYDGYTYCLGGQYLNQGGRFVCVFDDSNLSSGSYVVGMFASNGAYQALINHQTGALPSGVVSTYWAVTPSPYTFNISAGAFDSTYSYFAIRSPSVVSAVYLLTEESYYFLSPSIASITLPTDFNPIWLYGDAYKGSVYGMLSTNAEGTSYTASLDVKFVSGGNLYDGIYFEFDHLANTWYQEPTSGEIVLADRNANNYHYPVGMYYRRFGQTASVPSSNPDAFDCVWSPVWALTNDSEGNTHRYLTPTGGFASDDFRVIDVKEYDASTPVSARWPNLDALALLRLKSSGFIITGDTNLYDAFELLGGAFRSVSDILNIQILPFMTLGMLFFIPLIVLVLFAIIRILNK